MGKILNQPQEFIDNLNDEEFLKMLNEMKIQYTRKGGLSSDSKINKKSLG